MYPLLVENMTDEEAYIQNLNIEVNSTEVCFFMCGENFGRILFEIFCGYRKQMRYLYVIKTGLIWTKIVVLF